MYQVYVDLHYLEHKYSQRSVVCAGPTLSHRCKLSYTWVPVRRIFPTRCLMRLRRAVECWDCQPNLVSLFNNVSFSVRTSSKSLVFLINSQLIITLFIQRRRKEDEISLTNSVAADLVGEGKKKHYTTSGFVVLPHIQRCEDQQW